MISRLRVLMYNVLVKIHPFILRRVYRMDIGKNVILSRRARLDRGINPKGIHIGDNSWITGEVIMLAHDYCRSLKTDTYIGKRCFIGTRSIILPGVKVGDEVIVAAGSVVTKDVPSHSIVAGNPAKIIRMNIRVDNRNKIIDQGEPVKK